MNIRISKAELPSLRSLYMGSNKANKTTIRQRKKQLIVKVQTYLTNYLYSLGHSNPLQNSCLKNPIDREARSAIVHGLQRAGHDWNDLAQHSLILEERHFDLKQISIILLLSANSRTSVRYAIKMWESRDTQAK